MLTLTACANCGTLTPAAAMLRDPEDGSLHCTECPGEGWLRRAYGRPAVEALRALRAGEPHRDFPGGLTLAAIVARYPERTGTGYPGSRGGRFAGRKRKVVAA